ncbi:MAG: M56 family metallopeptidase, partial [Flavobacteriales bacterium]
MEELALYLFKSVICNAIFLGIYVLFFKKQTFFQFNRYFLVAGIFLSVLLPFYTYTYEVTLTVQESNTSNFAPIVALSKNGFASILFIGYLLGTIFFVARYLLGIIKIKSLISHAGYDQFQNYRLVSNKKVRSSFSVFNYVFLETSASLPEKEKQLILAHELAHVRQRHWADLLLVQLFCTMQWFNPLAWIYRKAIRENHEYLADQAVLQQGTSLAMYRAVLVNQCIGLPVFEFSSSFYQYSMPRLTLLSQPSSRRINKFAVLLILPAIALFYRSFAETRITIKTIPSKSFVDLPTSVSTVEEIIPIAGASTPKKAKETDRASSKRSVKITNINAVASNAITESNPKPLIDTYPSPTPIFILDGLEIPAPNMNDIDPNTIAAMHVLKHDLAIKEFGVR